MDIVSLFCCVVVTMAGKTNRNTWTAKEMNLMKSVIINEAKGKKRVSADELASFFDEKTPQSIAAKHRAMAQKMFMEGDVRCDVTTLESAAGICMQNQINFF